MPWFIPDGTTSKMCHIITHQIASDKISVFIDFQKKILALEPTVLNFSKRPSLYVLMPIKMYKIVFTPATIFISSHTREN